MTYTKQSWVDNTTPVDASHMNHIEDGLAITAPGYGTTFPASPSDGQEFVLVDSVTAPNYQWRFRYNAGSTSAYKWEFIGGTQVYVEAAGPDNVSNAGAWDNIPNGPAWALPRAGDWMFEADSVCSCNQPDAQMYLGIGDAGVPNSLIGMPMYAQQSPANRWGNAHTKSRGAAVPAGTSITLKAYGSGGAAFVYTHQNRRLTIIPIRLS